MTELAIEATGLTKSFGVALALAGVDLAAPKGSVLAVLGPNGAGKTTAVRILATLLRADAGSARVNGFDVRKQPDKVRESIGLTGQFASVDEDLTGMQNLVMIGQLLDLPKRAARQRADELLAWFDLTAAANRVAKKYSGGMRRRLDLAASLVGRPQVIFLDEPTTGLDPAKREDMWDVVRSLVSDGSTVLLTTQYLDEADALADEITVIDHGRVIAHDTPHGLKRVVGGQRLTVRPADPARHDDLLNVLRDIGGQHPEDDGRGTVTVRVDGDAPATAIEAPPSSWTSSGPSIATRTPLFCPGGQPPGPPRGGLRVSGRGRWRGRRAVRENGGVESDFDFSVESRLVHGGTERAQGAPLGPPLTLTSVYVSQGEPGDGPGYGRNGNPGWAAVESGLAAMEGAGAMAVTFASGQAASMALMLALAEGRETIVFPVDGYYNTRALAGRLRPHGARAVAVDLLDLDAVAGALRAGPAVLWAETPTNPLLRVADLTALASLAAAAGAPFVVDNTVATGLLQKPLDFGAAASVYSLTKSLSGHSDVLGGAVVTKDAGLAAAVRSWRADGGAIPGPLESWLVLRGLKTLDLRTGRTSANALAVATFLSSHPRVTAVHYPGLSPSAVAVKQMPRGFGPLLSFEISGAAADADAVVAAARLIVPATSFGGVESSWERRARWPAETAPPTLIRMSCGIEPAEDLLADVAAALEAGT